jgi:hypothetical protein
MTTMRDRRGIALVAALLLISFIALLIAGSLSATTIADRATALAQIDARLMSAADFLLHSAIASPDTYGLPRLPLGATRPLIVAAPDPLIDARVSATRLPDGVVWLVADVAVPQVDGAHRRVNLVATYPRVMPVPAAPIVSRGDVRVGAGAVFNIDSTNDVDCRATSPPQAMLAPGATATGIAATVADARAQDSATYGLRVNQLASLRGAGIVRTAGDTTVQGTFSGILVVNGNLTLDGPFRATGLVIARGSIDANGHAFAIRGSVLSFAIPTTQPAMNLGDATIEFAPCVIQEMLWNVSILTAVKYRSWQEMF